MPHYGIKRIGGLNRDEVFLSFLPLSHILERTGGYYVTLLSGNHIAFAEDVKKVMENMAEIRPTWMVSVPRLFEKIYSRIFENVHQMSTLRKRLFHRAVKIGREYVNKKYVQKVPVGTLALRYRFFDRLVFKKIRDRFGGRLKATSSAAARRWIKPSMSSCGPSVFRSTAGTG